MFVIGTNYRRSSTEIRESVSLSRESRKKAFLFVKKSRYLREAVFLSTCNRTEVYFLSSEPVQAKKEVQELFRRIAGFEGKDFFSQFYTYESKRALHHLFNVCAGLDSMIVGETQILGQVKEALVTARKNDLVSSKMSGVFRAGLSVAKKVHAETGISEGKVSIGSITVKLLRQECGTITEKKILILGVGKVTKLLLKYLKKDVGIFFIANRTYEKARKLADSIGAEVARFNDLEKVIERTDIIISATSSPHLILKKKVLTGATRKPLIIVDLAVPRDVDPKIKSLKSVQLYDLKDIQHMIEDSLHNREQEAEEAEKIVAEESERRWKEHISLGPEKVLWP